MTNATPSADNGPQVGTPTSRAHLSPNQRAWRRFRSNRLAVWSLWVLMCLALLVIAWPVALHVASVAGPKGAQLVQRLLPDQLSDDQFEPPSLKHWFGTDV